MDDILMPIIKRGVRENRRQIVERAAGGLAMGIVVGFMGHIHLVDPTTLDAFLMPRTFDALAVSAIVGGFLGTGLAILAGSSGEWAMAPFRRMGESACTLAYVAVGVFAVAMAASGETGAITVREWAGLIALLTLIFLYCFAVEAFLSTMDALYEDTRESSFTFRHRLGLFLALSMLSMGCWILIVTIQTSYFA